MDLQSIGLSVQQALWTLVILAAVALGVLLTFQTAFARSRRATMNLRLQIARVEADHAAMRMALPGR